MITLGRLEHAELLQELAAVREELAEVADGLVSPLGQLVRAQVKQAAPHLRAQVVLASAINADTVGSEQAIRLKRRRIYLAAALETLFVAHHIHRQLLISERTQDLDRSVMGSTILAGDYCFGRSAMLATQTESPEVVAIFARTLKTMSEGNLRRLFGESELGDENLEIFLAGVDASVVLAQLSQQERDILATVARSLNAYAADEGRPSGHEAMAEELRSLERLPVACRRRWSVLLNGVAGHQACSV